MLNKFDDYVKLVPPPNEGRRVPLRRPPVQKPTRPSPSPTPNS